MRIYKIRFGVVFLIVIFSQKSFCQDRQMRYGFLLYPHLSDGVTSKNDTNSFYYKGSKTMSFTYSAGFIVEMETKSHWGIVIGLNFQRTGDRSKLFPWDANRGFPSRSYKHWHDYIEFQLNVLRTFNNKWIMEAGVSPLINVGNEVRYFHEGNGDPFKTEIDQNVKSKFGITGNFGFGYILNKDHFLVKVMPYTQFNFIQPVSSYDFKLNGIVMDYLPSRKYLNFGIRLTTMFNFETTQ